MNVCGVSVVCVCWRGVWCECGVSVVCACWRCVCGACGVCVLEARVRCLWLCMLEGRVA